MTGLLILGGLLVLVSAALARHDQVEARRVMADLGRASSSDEAETRLTEWDADRPIGLTLTDRGWGWLDEQREEWHA